MKHPSKRREAPQSPPGEAHHPGSDTLIRALFQTPETFRILGVVVPDILSAWAGEGKLKGAAAGAMGRTIQTGFFQAAQGAPEESLKQVLEDPVMVREAATLLPHIVNGGLSLLEAATATLAALPADERREIITRFIEGMDTALLGRNLTALFRLFPEVDDVETLAPLLRSKTASFLEAVDFGELAQAASRSESTLLPLWNMVMEELWAYPAKVVSLLSPLPQLSLFLVKAATSTIKPFNNLAPDVLADVLVSLLHDVKGEPLGELVNETTELIRKIHTGSTLIGSPGHPRLPMEVTRLVEETLEAVAPEPFLAAHQAITELSDAISEKRMEMLEADPEHGKRAVRQGICALNRPVRALERWARLLESLASETDLADDLARGLSDLNPSQLADTLNRFFCLAGDVFEKKPTLLKPFLTSFANTLDQQEGGRWAASLTRAALPPLLHGLSDILEEEPLGGPIHEALQRVSRALAGTREVA